MVLMLAFVGEESESRARKFISGNDIARFSNSIGASRFDSENICITAGIDNSSIRFKKFFIRESATCVP